MTPMELYLKQLSELKPALSLKEGQSLEEWRPMALQKLRDLMGMDYFESCDPAFQTEEIIDKGGYVRTRFSFQSEEGYRVPGYFLAPKTGFREVMICLQGHSTGMHISLGEVKYPQDAGAIAGGRDYAIQAVTRGYAALVIEQRCFGECGGKHGGGLGCEKPTILAIMLGKTTIGGRVWDVMRAIDVAEAHFSPGARYCCMGNSGGGKATYYTAALEPRIAKAMPSCSIFNHAGHIPAKGVCPCSKCIPGFCRWFEVSDVAGLIAPRPMLMVHGELDHHCPGDQARKTFVLIQKYYDAAGAPEAFRVHTGAEGHRFYPEAWGEFGGI